MCVHVHVHVCMCMCIHVRLRTAIHSCAAISMAKNGQAVTASMFLKDSMSPNIRQRRMPLTKQTTSDASDQNEKKQKVPRRRPQTLKDLNRSNPSKNLFLSFRNQLPGSPTAVNGETPKTKSVSVALEVQWSARQGGTAARRAQWQVEFFLFQFKK